MMPQGWKTPQVGGTGGSSGAQGNSGGAGRNCMFFRPIKPAGNRKGKGGDREAREKQQLQKTNPTLENRGRRSVARLSEPKGLGLATVSSLIAPS